MEYGIEVLIKTDLIHGESKIVKTGSEVSQYIVVIVSWGNLTNDQ